MNAYRVVLRNIDKGTATPLGLPVGDYPLTRAQLVLLEGLFPTLHQAGCRSYLAVEPTGEVAR